MKLRGFPSNIGVDSDAAKTAAQVTPGTVEQKKGKTKLKKLSMLFWLIPAILSPFLLLRGIWALQQPWGVQSQKIGGLVFFFILWIVSLYFLFEKKLTKNLNLTAREEEKRKWAFHAIGSAAFGENLKGQVYILGENLKGQVYILHKPAIL